MKTSTCITTVAVLLAILFGCQAGVYAAVRQRTAGEVLSGFDARFRELDTLVFKKADVATSERNYRNDERTQALGISHDGTPDSLYVAAVNALTEARRKEIYAQTGLQLTGQTYYRLDGAFGIDEDDNVSVYRAKLQAELRWYFLQSSVFKRAGRLEQAELEGNIDILTHEKQRVDLSVYRQKELLRHLNDSVLSGILLHRVKNLRMLSEANLYLLNNENVSSDELLKILDEKAQAERQLAMAGADYPAALSLRRPDVWLITVDTARMIDHILATQVDIRLLKARMELLDKQQENESWWSDVRIAPFVRYSGYLRSGGNVSNNVDAGVSFTIPINTESAKRRNVLGARKQELAAEEDGYMAEVKGRMLYICQETDRLNRAIEGEWERVAELRDYLEMRNHAYNNRIGEYSRLSRMKEYNTYIGCLEKLVGYEYERDCLIADMQVFLADEPILNYLNVSLLSDEQ